MSKIIIAKYKNSVVLIILLLTTVVQSRGEFGFNYWPGGYSCDVLYETNWTVPNKEIVKADLDLMASFSTQMLRLMVWPQKSGYNIQIGAGSEFTQDFEDVTDNFLEILEMCSKRDIGVILSFGNNYFVSINQATDKYWWEEAYGTGDSAFTEFLGDTRIWMNGFIDKIEASPWASTVRYYDYLNEWSALRKNAVWYLQYVYEWTNVPEGKRYLSLLHVQEGLNDAVEAKSALGDNPVDAVDFHSYPLMNHMADIEAGFDLTRVSFPTIPIYLGEYGAAGITAGDETTQQATVLDLYNRASAKGFAGMLHWMLWDNAPPSANQIIGWGYTYHEPKDVMGAMAELLSLVPNPDMENLNGIEPAGWSAGGTVPFTFYYNTSAATNSLCARILVNNTAGKAWMSSSLIPATGGKKLFLNCFIRSSMENIQMSVTEFDINQQQIAVFNGPSITPPAWQWYSYTHLAQSWFIPLSKQARFITVSVGGQVTTNPSILDVDTVTVWESQKHAYRSDFNDDSFVDKWDLFDFVNNWLFSDIFPGWDNIYDLALPQNSTVNYKDFEYISNEWTGNQN